MQLIDTQKAKTQEDPKEIPVLPWKGDLLETLMGLKNLSEASPLSLDQMEEAKQSLFYALKRDPDLLKELTVAFEKISNQINFPSGPENLNNRV